MLKYNVFQCPSNARRYFWSITFGTSLCLQQKVGHGDVRQNVGYKRIQTDELIVKLSRYCRGKAEFVKITSIRLKFISHVCAGREFGEKMKSSYSGKQNPWQRFNHTKLYSDFLQAWQRELIALGSLQRGPQVLQSRYFTVGRKCNFVQATG